MKRFYWNPETLSGFRKEAKHLTTAELLTEVTLFVEDCCDLEDGETEEDLIQDLLYQILSE